MKKKLFILVLLSSINAFGQTLLNPKGSLRIYEKEYEPPPGQFYILKWFHTSFPETYNGWKISFKEKMKMTGWTEGYIYYEVAAECDTCDFLNKYVYNIHLSYGFDHKTEVSVIQNMDTTDKYLRIKYPEFGPRHELWFKKSDDSHTELHFRRYNKWRYN